VNRLLEVLEVFVDEGSHNRCFVHRDPLRRSDKLGGDSIWRQYVTPELFEDSLRQKHASQQAERYRNDPTVRAKAAERYRREQDERVLREAKKLPPDQLARERVLCNDCKKMKPGAGWCPVHERVTMRNKLEKERRGKTHHFVILTPKDPHEFNSPIIEIDGYVTANLDAAGRLGEIFVRIGKMGDASAIVDLWAMAMSIALQRGEPVKSLFSKCTHTQFWPYGGTRNEKIPRCDSPCDYISKWILMEFSTVTNWEEGQSIPVVEGQP